MMKLLVLPARLAVCHLAPERDMPAWVWNSDPFLSITRTEEELSIVCLATSVPDNVQSERNWVALKVQGPLAFSLTGILASLAQPLAAAHIPIFALSTFDTDYILVKEQSLQLARETLSQYGHTFE